MYMYCICVCASELNMYKYNLNNKQFYIVLYDRMHYITIMQYVYFTNYLKKQMYAYSIHRTA